MPIDQVLMQWLGGYRLGMRMKIFILLSLLVALGVGLPMLLEMRRLAEALDKHDQEHMHTVQQLGELHLSRLKTQLLVLELLTGPEPHRLAQIDLQLERQGQSFRDKIERLMRWLPEYNGRLIDLRSAYFKRESLRQQISRMVANGQVEQARQRLFDSAHRQSVTEEMDAPLRELVSLVEAEHKRILDASLKAYHEAIAQVVVSALVGSLLFLLLALLFSRALATPMRLLRDEIGALAQGERERSIPFLELDNEFGEMARALERLQDASRELEARTWAKSQLAETLGTVQDNDDLYRFGDALLQRLCPQLDSPLAVLFVELAGQITTVASFGIERDEVQAAGGLVSQCMHERRTLWLEARQDGGLRLHSGMCELEPHDLMLMPLQQQGKVMGVLEVALMCRPDHARRLLLDDLPLLLAPMIEVLRSKLASEEMAGQLEVRENEMRLLLESRTDGIFGVDREGVITFANPATLKLLGYAQAQDLVGRPFRGLVHLDEEAECLLHGAMERNTPHGSESEQFICADGGLLIVSCAISPLTQNGEVVGAVISFQDATLTQALNAERERARLMAEEASRLKSRFLANMSHEIRTPMNAIVGLTELTLGTELSPLQNGYLNKLRQAGQHLLAIVDNVLDLSRIESGRLELEARDFSLLGVRERILALFSEKALNKGLKLTLELADEVPRRLHGDSLRLGQVLINYVNNAIKFTQQGYVAVRVERLDGEEGDDGSIHLRFEVEDSGVGLDAQQQSQLFQSFTQADNSITRKHGGTGLGLAICRQLVALMGGEVGVESEPGQGSTFWFTVRLAPAETTAVAAAGSAPPLEALQIDLDAALAQRVGKRILVVEDNELNQSVLSEILQRSGFRVALAGDGAQALAWLQQHNCDLVLMDLQMPNLDGFQTTQALRQKPQWADLPVVAMTANVIRETRDQCASMGMNDFLAKPVKLDALWRSLVRWIPVDELVVRPAAATNADVSEDLSRLQQQGLDTSRAMNRMMGDPRLYLKSVTKFCALQKNFTERVRTALEHGEWQEVQLMIHTLKGSAGVIGAERLHQLAGALHREMAENIDPNEADRQRFQTQLAELEQSLDYLLQGLDGPLSQSTPAADDAQADLEHFATLLAQSDPEALDWWQQHARQLAERLPPDRYSALAAAVEAFDLDSAQSLLQQSHTLEMTP
ncbi:MAG: ATP-binding protein [Gammaproteobacteria bacterium SHHR-1]